VGLVFTTPKTVVISGQNFTVTEAIIVCHTTNKPITEPPFNKRHPQFGTSVWVIWQEGYRDGGSNFVKVGDDKGAAIYDDPNASPPDDTIYTDALAAAPAGAFNDANLYDALQSQKDGGGNPWLPAGAVS
jgi:hypothetical protein